MSESASVTGARAPAAHLNAPPVKVRVSATLARSDFTTLLLEHAHTLHSLATGQASHGATAQSASRVQL